VAASDRKSGLSLPTSILQSTAQPEAPAAEEATEPTKATRSKARKKPAGDKVEDMKLYLTEDVRFRLRMKAFKDGKKISTVANEVLDKALPRWTLERTE
jgi:hypothetical protein